MRTRNTNSPGSTIAAIVVTCNRLSLLKESIESLRSQTYPPDEIIVVDNGSSDDTPVWLSQQTDLTVLRQHNLGSSGGQYTGLREAFIRGHAWFWCMDDDTIAHVDALERLICNPEFASPETGFLASVVVWTDGNPHQMNTPGTTHQTEWFHTVLRTRAVRVRTSSFVSVLVSRTALAKVGLPLRNLFIWYDDVEFTSRISTHFKGFIVLDSIVVHKTVANTGALLEPVGAKDRVKYLYGSRNRIIAIRFSGNPTMQRWAAIICAIGSTCKRAALGRAPWAGLLWAIRGLLYRPRVEFPPESRFGPRTRCAS